MLTLIISSTGFFYLFKLLYKLLDDAVLAMAFTFLFLSSTVLLYYSNNFLPDASAFGLTLIGWYLFFEYLIGSRRKRTVIICFFFFSLASLIRVTYLINPISAVLSIFIYDISTGGDLKRAFRQNILPFILFSSSAILVLAWNLYVVHYNKVNNDYYFLVQARPIWGIARGEISFVWDHITIYWYHSYYYHRTTQFYFFIVIASLLFLKNAKKIVLIPSIFLLVGSTCYFLLFYAQFKDHDYYFIAILPAIILTVINSFICLRCKFPKIVNRNVVKILLIALCFLSLRFAGEMLAERYKNKGDSFAIIGSKLATTRQYLDSLGISTKAKVIIVTDETPNGGLYFINRPGWNIKDTTQESMGLVQKYISEGAEYILFTEKKFVDDKFTGQKIGEKNGISIYELTK